MKWTITFGPAFSRSFPCAKDQARIVEAVEAVKSYVPPQDGSIVKSDYEIVSVLCYDNGWRMNADQWKNFIAAVRKVIAEEK